MDIASAPRQTLYKLFTCGCRGNMQFETCPQLCPHLLLTVLRPSGWKPSVRPSSALGEQGWPAGWRPQRCTQSLQDKECGHWLIPQNLPVLVERNFRKLWGHICTA